MARKWNVHEGDLSISVNSNQWSPVTSLGSLLPGPGSPLLDRTDTCGCATGLYRSMLPRTGGDLRDQQARQTCLWLITWSLATEAGFKAQHHCLSEVMSP